MSSSAGKKKAREKDTQELIEEAKKMGRPRFFLNAEFFESKLTEYMQLCQDADNRIPTIFGFARYTETSAETVRMCEEYFPSSYKKMQAYFQDAIVNCKHTKNNMGIFVLKDNFGWRDGDQQVSGITVNYNNVPSGQLESWLRDSGLTLSEPSEE